MAHLLPTLAAVYGACCVWLIVRAANRRQIWAKWTLPAVVGLPVLYVASLGPALRLCYLLDQPPWLCQLTMAFYPPLFQVMSDDSVFGRWYLAYLEWWEPWVL